MLRRLLALALSLALPAAATAQTVQNVFAEAGMLGRWASDCTRPPSADNVHTIYAVAPAGEVTLTYDHGAPPATSHIVSAKLLAPDRLAYRQENRKTGAQLDIELAISATHIRVWTSRRSTGQLLVANGKFTSDGVESPLQARCP